MKNTLLLLTTLLLFTFSVPQLALSDTASLSIKELTTLAEQGDAEAQLNLGNRYKDGNEVKQDIKKALEWYEKSAEQGLTRAQNITGIMYLQGIGVAPEPQKAFILFENLQCKVIPMVSIFLG